MVSLKEHHPDVYAGELILPLPSSPGHMHAFTDSMCTPSCEEVITCTYFQHAVDHGHEHARKCISEGSIGEAVH